MNGRVCFAVLAAEFDHSVGPSRGGVAWYLRAVGRVFGVRFVWCCGESYRGRGVVLQLSVGPQVRVLCYLGLAWVS